MNYEQDKQKLRTFVYQYLANEPNPSKLFDVIDVLIDQIAMAQPRFNEAAFKYYCEGFGNGFNLAWKNKPNEIEFHYGLEQVEEAYDNGHDVGYVQGMVDAVERE